MPGPNQEDEAEATGSYFRAAFPLLAYFLMFLVVLGFVWQAAGSALAGWQHPPPGEMVEVYGFDLHLLCEGEGTPTVIFEPGLGDAGHTFRQLQKDLAAEQRACVYDRAGLGWSDRSRTPRSVAQLSDELQLLLERADVPGPYVLVAHSFGTLVARDFALHHPEQMAGLILMEPIHEGDEASQAPTLLQGSVPVYRLVSTAGLTRAIWHFIQPRAETAEDRAARATMFRSKHLWSFADYLSLIMGYPGGDYGPLHPDLPIRVLTAARDDTTDEDALFLQFSAELAALSERGQHMVVDGAGHYIYRDRPEVVVDAVRQVIAESRAEAQPAAETGDP